MHETAAAECPRCADKGADSSAVLLHVVADVVHGVELEVMRRCPWQRCLCGVDHMGHSQACEELLVQGAIKVTKKEVRQQLDWQVCECDAREKVGTSTDFIERVWRCRCQTGAVSSTWFLYRMRFMQYRDHGV